MLLFNFIQEILSQVPTPVNNTNASTFSWEIAATVLGVAALIIGAIVKIFADGKNKSTTSDDVVKHINDVTNQINIITNRVNELSSKIAALEVESKNLISDNDEMKALVRDIERDNFNALNKVVDKVDHIKDMLIEKLNKK